MSAINQQINTQTLTWSQLGSYANVSIPNADKIFIISKLCSQISDKIAYCKNPTKSKRSGKVNIYHTEFILKNTALFGDLHIYPISNRGVNSYNMTYSLNGSTAMPIELDVIYSVISDEFKLIREQVIIELNDIGKLRSTHADNVANTEVKTLMALNTALNDKIALHRGVEKKNNSIISEYETFTRIKSFEVNGSKINLVKLSLRRNVNRLILSAMFSCLLTIMVVSQLGTLN